MKLFYSPASPFARALGSLLGYLDLRMPERDWRARYPLLRDWSIRITRRRA